MTRSAGIENKLADLVLSAEFECLCGRVIHDLIPNFPSIIKNANPPNTLSQRLSANCVGQRDVRQREGISNEYRIGRTHTPFWPTTSQHKPSKLLAYLTIIMIIMSCSQ